MFVHVLETIGLLIGKYAHHWERSQSLHMVHSQHHADSKKTQNCFVKQVQSSEFSSETVPIQAELNLDTCKGLGTSNLKLII